MRMLLRSVVAVIIATARPSISFAGEKEEAVTAQEFADLADSEGVEPEWPGKGVVVLSMQVKGKGPFHASSPV
jgi:hypothetical protein